MLYVQNKRNTSKYIPINPACKQTVYCDCICMYCKRYFYASIGSNKFGTNNKLPHQFMTHDLGENFKIGKTDVTVYDNYLQFCTHNKQWKTLFCVAFKSTVTVPPGARVHLYDFVDVCVSQEKQPFLEQRWLALNKQSTCKKQMAPSWMVAAELQIQSRT